MWKRDYFFTATAYLVIVLAVIIASRWIMQAYSRNVAETFSIMGKPSVSADVVHMTTAAIALPLELQSARDLSQPLKTYIVKSSNNSAYGGTMVSVENIRYVLSRGCRLLDFEVFAGTENTGNENEITVAFSSNTIKSGYNITSIGKLRLYDALTVVFTGAFSAPSPNPLDPLFVRLRLAKPTGNDTSQYAQMCRLVRGAIIAAIPTRLYRNQVSKDTLLQQLAGNIVLILDNVPDPDLAALAAITISTDIAGANEPVLRAYTYPSPNSNTLRIAATDRATNENVEYSTFFQNYGVQFGEMNFYTPDNELAAYEMLFNHFKTAFVSVQNADEYLRSLE
jgi:hypothetical protein